MSNKKFIARNGFISNSSIEIIEGLNTYLTSNSSGTFQGSNVVLSNNNLLVGNSSVNSIVSQTNVISTNFNATNSFAVSANVILTNSTLFVGNSTVNTVVNSSMFAINGSNVTLLGHPHVISDVTGLQSNLDSKVNKIGDIMSGALIVGNSTVNTVLSQTNVISTNFNASNNITIGSNVSILTTGLSIGNSTVNSTANSIGIYSNNVKYALTSTTISGGSLASGSANIAANLILNVISANVSQFRSATIANTAQTAISVGTVWDSALLVTLTDAATVTVDLSTGINFKLTLGGNRTIGAPTNTKEGQSGILLIKQDNTGSRTLAWNSVYKFGSGTIPTLTTTANATDKFSYFVESASIIHMSSEKDSK